MKNKKSYLLILILLFFSGNPLITFLFGKFSTVVGLTLTILIIYKSIRFSKKFIKLIFIIVTGILIIGVFQHIKLGYVSVLGMINLVIKFLLGGIIINYLKKQFASIFFKVIADLSLISLMFYLVVNIFGIVIPSITLGPEIESYIIYGTSTELHMLKNAGMFWEPGAFAGILTLCLALNYNNLKNYWFEQPFKLGIIILALLTTQSTTGYLVGAIIFLFLLFKGKNIFIVPVFVFAITYIYETTDFLKEKIEIQIEKSSNQKVGEFSNTRFGSLIFDWYYIQKHPFIGNGLNEKTRYSEHQYLFVGEKGDAIASGNGFTGYLASLGVFFLIGFFYFLWKATNRQGLFFAFIVVLVVLLNLQGEQWFNYPLYLGLPFIILQKKKNKTSKAKILIPE
ncbi:hypothetical protein [Flavobacterium myungsuense]|uniref:O-antigen ligase domain-containing protein n=2 Tax=Flavobacterium myungsuense TaxID=651823 RepID=A0ABW3IZK5_9FLAO